MGLGAYLLGGALAGAGKGLADRGAADAEARRQHLLEMLRSQNRMAEDGNKAVLDDNLDASRQRRKAEYDAENDARSLQNSATLEGIKHKNAIDLEGVKYGHDVSLEGIKASHQVSLATVKANLDKRNDRDAALLKDAMDRGDVAKVLQDKNGYFITVTKDGRYLTTGVKGMPKGGSGNVPLTRDGQTLSDDEDTGDQDIGGGLDPNGKPQLVPKAGAKPAPKPAAKPQPQGKRISMTEYSRLATEIGNSKDPRVAGLNAAQRKAKLDSMLKAQGLLPP